MASARVAAASAAGVSFRGGVSRAADVSARTQTTVRVAADVRSVSADDNVRDWPGKAEFERGREESQRYWESLGYTEETFMEMVAEEVRAYRREKAEQKARANK